MKKLKNIIGVLIFIITIVGMGTVSFAENTSKEITVLTKLGIIEDNFSVQEEMTRAEFASIICKTLKLEELDKTYFSDVPRSHYAAGAISALVEMDIISLSPEGKFNPETKITYEQACKILVCALGYNDFVNYYELGMKAYPMAAADIGFSITSNSAETLTKAEAIELLFNAMTVNITVNKNGGGSVITSIDEENTLFSKYYDVYYDEGQLRGLYGASFNDFNLKKNEICIDNEIMVKDETLDLESLFGEEIGYIYIEKKDDKTVLYAEPVGKSKSLEINSSEIESFDFENYILEYYDGSKERKVNIAKDATVCLNGKGYTKTLNEKFQEFIEGEKKGTVKFISTSGTSDYDIVIIKSYEVFVLGAYDSGKETYYDYYESAKTFSPEEYKNLRIIDSEGRETTMPTAYPAPVLILTAEDKSYAEIIRFDKKTNISISQIYDDEKIVTADGEYEIDKNIYSYVKNIVSVGGTYSTVIDIYNEIIFISDVNEESKNIGFIRQVLINEDDTEAPMSFKLYTTEGVTNIYRLANRVKIDNISYNSNDSRAIVLAFPGQNDLNLDTGKVTLQRQPILFEVNPDNEIISIDTYIVSDKEIKEKSLQMIDSGKSYYFTAATSKYGATMVVNSNTKYIVAPDVGTDGTVNVNGIKLVESDEMYTNKFAGVDWSRYNVEGYKFNENTMATDLIVLKIAPKNVNHMSYMFDNTAKVVDEDGEVCDNLNVYSEGTQKVLGLGDTQDISTLGLNKGDVFMIELDFTGKKAMTVTKQFDAETLTFTKNNDTYFEPDRPYWYGAEAVPGADGGTGGWRSDKWQLLKGYVYDLKGGVIGISYTLADANEGIINERYNVASLKVTVFDKNKDKEQLYAGTLNDIITYKNAGEECDLVLIGGNGSSAKQLFVYKR